MIEALFKFFVDHPATISAFIAVLSLFTTVSALYMQRKHYRRSVRPIASFPVGDYENEISVRLENRGIGPLHILRLRAHEGNTTKNSIIEYMPELPAGVTWSTFYGDADGAWVQPGKSLHLLQLSGRDTDPSFRIARDLCRGVLGRLIVSVEYEDIYERKMPVVSRNLAWFGRHLEKSEK